MSTLKEKLKVVQTAVAAIEKQFGKGAIMSLGGEAEDIAVIPTGSVACRAAVWWRFTDQNRPVRPR